MTKKLTSLFTFALLLTSTMTAQAEDSSELKRVLKGSMELEYSVVPNKADTFLEIFTKGQFYGRLRSNTFYFDWKDDASPLKQKDNYVSALGGSLIYKTAPFHGVGTTLGAFYTYALWNMGVTDISDPAGFMKSGKDTFSRYYVANGLGFGLFSLAQASVDYTIGKTKLEYGAQIFESVFTKSNDTKMIPNTFNGLVIQNKDIEGTTLRAAYLTSQKLRDHGTFHDVITYNTNGTGVNEKWNGNDDSGVHKGLSFANFTAAGQSTSHALAIATAKSQISKDLTMEASYAYISGVVGNLALEANYIINAGKTQIVPGVRYMLQHDLGGGAIGGAALTGDVNASNAASKGYTLGDSLNGGLIAARIDVIPEGMFKFRLGYSYIFDQADIIAPWRGFPTGGYTRAMAQLNWIANTTTYMARVDAKLTKDIKFLVRYAIQDFDDLKSGAQADSSVLHTDWMFNLKALANGLEAKVRVGIVNGGVKGTNPDNTYNEYRFELNYLF